MKAYLINMHLLVPRSRSSAKVKVKYKGYISPKMAISGAFVFHKYILLIKFLLSPFRFVLDDGALFLSKKTKGQATDLSKGITEFYLSLIHVKVLEILCKMDKLPALIILCYKHFFSISNNVFIRIAELY